jgi:dinuclear metal center protein, YbgI/SA1388 family
MKIKEVVSALERFAPLPLQDGFDNAGLQIGLTDAETAGALLCLDVTESVLDEAISLGCNLVISHHPLIFKGLKSITGKDYVERCILKAIKNDIVIYSAHTNLDNTTGGVNFRIAAKIGLKNIKFLAEKQDSLLKLVTFVPASHAAKVRDALFMAGAGSIGNYDCCSYNLKGGGTFRALEGTKPFVGKQGEIHEEEEIRIETVLPMFKKRTVLKGLLSVHPYEEPVFDFYELKNSWSQAGSGIIGELETSETETEFLRRIKKIFEVGCLKHNKLSGRLIKKVALCGGAGAFLLSNAVGKNADAFITGEIKYHDYFGHESDLLIAEIGHYESEQYTKEIFFDIIQNLLPDFKVYQTKINTNPIKYL